ncbi:hypothetical protein [Nocardia sp. BMG51109]|uniref:hypothetical protein n=1 Tax=Nocardia sp. BMG51109 TaxID=1056816 RepID=UPI0012EC23A5|nr:hypothetical protein [Nocardia sp. BMG51109]
MRTPRSVIIDTDIWFDADDVIAVAIAALTVLPLSIVTSDETGGRRAGATRRFLDSFGRTDVPVVAGRGLADSAERFLVDDYIADTPAQPTDVAGMVARVCDTGSGVDWVGMV